MGCVQTGVIKPAGIEHQAPLGLRTVAIFEFFKGLLAVFGGFWFLSLVGKDVPKEADKILHFLHFDPAWHLTHILVGDAARLNAGQQHPHAGVLGLDLCRRPVCGNLRSLA